MLIKCIDAVVFHCKPQERADFDYFAYLHSFFEKKYHHDDTPALFFY